MARILTAVFAALVIVSIGGCGSDEPTLKDMTPAEREAQAVKQREHQIESMKNSSNSKGYQDDAKKRAAMGS